MEGGAKLSGLRGPGEAKTQVRQGRWPAAQPPRTAAREEQVLGGTDSPVLGAPSSVQRWATHLPPTTLDSDGRVGSGWGAQSYKRPQEVSCQRSWGGVGSQRHHLGEQRQKCSRGEGSWVRAQGAGGRQSLRKPQGGLRPGWGHAGCPKATGAPGPSVCWAQAWGPPHTIRPVGGAQITEAWAPGE